MQHQDDSGVPDAPGPDQPNRSSANFPDAIRREVERRWSLEHADFVAAHNATIDAEGLPLDVWRMF